MDLIVENSMEIQFSYYIYNRNFQIVCMDTAISIKVVPEQSGKVEYERERLLGIAKKCINFFVYYTHLVMQSQLP
jgi:hypothetical protein